MYLWLHCNHCTIIVMYLQTFLAVYVLAGGETALAQKCLFRARLMVLTVHGEDHPYIATLDVGCNILITVTLCLCAIHLNLKTIKHVLL